MWLYGKGYYYSSRTQMAPATVNLTDIDLGLAAAQRSYDELQLSMEKPQLSTKAQSRVTRRNRSPTGREGPELPPMSSLATSTLVAGSQGLSGSLGGIGGMQGE